VEEEEGVVAVVIWWWTWAGVEVEAHMVVPDVADDSHEFSGDGCASDYHLHNKIITDINMDTGTRLQHNLSLPIYQMTI